MSTISTRIVEPLRWLMVIGIAYTLATSVIFFVGGPASAPRDEARNAPSRIPDRTSAVSVNAIVSRNLFGVAGTTEAVVAQDVPAVETRLPLELRGVFVADAPADSVAIVAQKGKPGEIYAVGATLPGSAELIEVHSDHIVLRRAGARETLRFPEFSAGSMVASGAQFAPPAGQDWTDEPPVDAAPWEEPVNEELPDVEGGDPQAAGGAETPRAMIDEYRERIARDPQGALADLGIAPVSPGAAEGYRLDAISAGSPYLRQTGLQPGDVILSVNGQQVGDVQRDQQQIENVLAQGSARLEVQRGSRRFFVTASLNQ